MTNLEKKVTSVGLFVMISHLVWSDKINSPLFTIICSVVLAGVLGVLIGLRLKK